MPSVDKIRNNLIDKILAIRNKEFLIALDNLIASSSSSSDIIELTPEQELMLQMSEEDIKKGRVRSQEDLKKKSTEWLRNKSS